MWRENSSRLDNLATVATIWNAPTYGNPLHHPTFLSKSFTTLIAFKLFLPRMYYLLLIPDDHTQENLCHTDYIGMKKIFLQYVQYIFLWIFYH